MEAYNQIYDYKSYFRYPDGLSKERKRELRRKASKYTLKDDIFLLKQPKVDSRWWTEGKDFQITYSDQLSGHFGRDKTRDKIWSRCFWHGTYQEIADKIARCDICQHAAKIFYKKHSELHSIPEKPEVWNRIGIDLFGPLTETFNKLFWNPSTKAKIIDMLIESILFAYRTSKHDSTKYTPFYLMCNREARIPVDVEISSKPDESSDAPETQLNFDEYVSQMMQIRERVKSAAKKTQDRQKKNYDKKYQSAAL